MLFSTRERENGENWPAFVFAMQSLPFISNFGGRKGRFSPKEFPTMCMRAACLLAESSSSGADESALKGTSAVRSHNTFCFLLHRRVGAFIGAPFQQLSPMRSGAVPQTDSKGVLWQIFASFLFVKKGRTRPGMRGMPAQVEPPRGVTC